MLASRRAPAAKRAPEIFERLHRAYPDARCALNFESPYQLLVATILSAQCTDKRVNMVTPELFRRYATPEALAAAKSEELEEIIKSTGFFRSKSRSLIGMATGIADKYGGVVPSRWSSSSSYLASAARRRTSFSGTRSIATRAS